jgi:hypothetical protein
MGRDQGIHYKFNIEEGMAIRQLPAPEDLESQQWKVV